MLIGALLGAEAHAADRVSMPFDCRSDGDGVHLTPSPERTYAIIGRREREVFTACSPEEPDRCRNWFVHRFDFDCGGARVAWMDAAEAAARYSDWDAWVEGNRFRMRMGRDWGVARSRPDLPRRRWRDRFAERDFGEDEGFVRRSGRFVELPAGFAPAVGVPLSFGAGEAEVAQADERPPYAAEPDSGESAVPPVAASERAAAPQVDLAPAPAPTPAPQAVTAAAAPTPPATPPIPALPERAPRRLPPPAASAPAAPAPAAPVEQAAAPAKPAEPPSTPDAPTIINAPGSAARVADYEERPQPSLEVKITKPASPGEPEVAQAPDAEPAPSARVPEPITPPAPVPAEPPRSAEAVTEVAKPQPTAETTVAAAHETSGTESVATSSIPPPASSAPAASPALMAMAAATVLALATLAAFGFWRGGRARAPVPATRDYASVSFGGPPGPASSAAPPSPIEAGPNLGPQLGLPPPVEAPVSEPEQSNIAMPKTYEEALAVLGASPDAELAAIKKVVDGLRKTWHPDLARSELDRIHRERRLQRINVAWDVVARRRSAAA